MLLGLFPDIKKACNLSQQLGGIYNQNNDKHTSIIKLAHWYWNIEESGFKNFDFLLSTLPLNYKSILSYFYNRSINASTESFIAKIKAFTGQFRGVRRIDFLLSKLSNIFG